MVQEINMENQVAQAVRQSTPTTASMKRRMSNKKPNFFIEEGDQVIPLKILGPNNEEILPEDIPVPPDGGYGWVIVFAAFMTCTVLGGTVFTFGVLREAIVKVDKELSRSTVASVGACFMACSLFTGPFAAAVSNKFGFRLTAVAGSLIGSFGFALAWFLCRDGVPRIPALILCYGVIGGVGVGHIMIPSIVSVGFYFERKRALATGIAVCGNGFGIIGIPPMLSQVILQIGWSGTVLVQAGLLLCCGAFALLYRPLGTSKKNSRRARSEEARSEASDSLPSQKLSNASSSVEENAESDPPRERLPSECQSFTESPPLGELVELPSLRKSFTLREYGLGQIGEAADDENDKEDKEKVVVLTEISPKQQEPEPEVESRPAPRPKFERIRSMGYLGQPKKSSIKPSARRRVSLGMPMMTDEDEEDKEDPFDGNQRQRQRSRILRVSDVAVFKRPMNRDNILFCGSVEQFKGLLQEDFNNMDSIFANSKWEDEDEEEDEEGASKTTTTTATSPRGKVGEKVAGRWRRWTESLNSMLHVVVRMLNVELLKSQTFLFICGMCLLSAIGLFVPYLYLIGFAQDVGCDPSDAAFLISVIGIADTSSRIFCGAIATKFGGHVVFMNNAALTVAGIVTLLTPFCVSYEALVIYACVFGFCAAAVSSLRSIILVELLGLSKLTNAYGLSIFCEGLAHLVGSPLAGFMRDSTGTYDLSFYVAGIFILLAGAIVYPIYQVKRWEESRLIKSGLKSGVV